MKFLHVYSGECGQYLIPNGVLAEAVALNAGKPLTDRRTKGARHLNSWGRRQDKQAREQLRK